jgi:hypothetical protein
MRWLGSSSCCDLRHRYAMGSSQVRCAHLTKQWLRRVSAQFNG